MNFNSCQIMGRLVRDPQMRFTPNNKSVVSFSVATGRKYQTSDGTDREDTLFLDCECWGKQGETINQYCKKGKPLFLWGRLAQDSWEDKQSGQKRSKIKLVVEGFQFVGGRDGGDESQPAPRSIGEGVRQKIASKAPAERPFGDEQVFTDESIPF